MNSKTTINISLAVLVVVALFGYSVYRYEHRPVTVPSTVSISKYNQAVTALNIQNSVTAKQLTQEQGAVSTLAGKQAALCTFIKSAKLSLSDPALCK